MGRVKIQILKMQFRNKDDFDPRETHVKSLVKGISPGCGDLAAQGTMSPLRARLWSAFVTSVTNVRRRLYSARSTTCEAWLQNRREMFSTFMAKQFLTKPSRELFNFQKEMAIRERCE